MRIASTKLLGLILLGAALPTVAADELCRRIAEFVRTSDDSSAHAVVLKGGWGGGQSDIVMTHDCMHDGYAPAMALCSYLLPHSSWEFGKANAEAVLGCLDRATYRSGLELLKLDQEMALKGHLRSTKYKVMITFRPTDEHGLSVLTISTVPPNTLLKRTYER
jgi:hypothetical protein